MEEIRIDRKSKYFFALMAIVIGISVSIMYYRYMVLHDYVVFMYEEDALLLIDELDVVTNLVLLDSEEN